MNDAVTTFDWNRVPPERFSRRACRETGLVLTGPSRGDIGVARMQRLLEQFVMSSSDDFPSQASIADIHGNVEGLRRELTFCRQRGVAAVVCTGDLIDRDPHSIAVIDELRAAQANFDLHVLLGNHDFFFMRALCGSKRDLLTWLGNGGFTVLAESEVGLKSWTDFFSRKAQAAGLSVTAWIRHALESSPEVLQAITEDIQGNACLQNVFSWMKDNLVLSYLNQQGLLYVHAGIPSHADGREALEYRQPNQSWRDRLTGGKTWHGLWAMARAEEDIFMAFEQKLPAHPAYDFLAHAHSPVWIRDWELTLESDQAKCERLLSSLGVTGIVVGHTVQSRTRSIHQGRLIMADRGLAQAYQNQPGVILSHFEEGVRCVTTSERTLSSRELFAKRMDAARHCARGVLGKCP